jgi:cysteine desulfurase
MHRIYFDNNATTKRSVAVVNGVSDLLYEPLNASSIHSYGRNARNLVESARGKIASALCVPKGFRILFTGSATEANNMIIHSAKLNYMRVFACKTEHPSINKIGIDKYLSVDVNGEVMLDEIIDVGLFSVMIANNETGVIQPIKKVLERVKSIGSVLHIDAVQAIGKIPFSCSEFAADAFTISGHKFGGPYGVGCLIYNPNTIKVHQLMFGGGQEYGVRPGTENVLAIHGLGIAISEVDARVQVMQEKILPLKNYIESEIQDFCSEVRIFGKDAKERLPNTISITMPSVKSELQVAYFDSHGIAVSAGAACSAGRVEFPEVQIAMMSTYEEASCTLRVSLGIENTMDEAKFFVQKWKELYSKNNNIGI